MSEKDAKAEFLDEIRKMVREEMGRSGDSQGSNVIRLPRILGEDKFSIAARHLAQGNHNLVSGEGLLARIMRLEGANLSEVENNAVVDAQKTIDEHQAEFDKKVEAAAKAAGQ